MTLNDTWTKWHDHLKIMSDLSEFNPRPEKGFQDSPWNSPRRQKLVDYGPKCSQKPSQDGSETPSNVPQDGPEPLASPSKLPRQSPERSDSLSRCFWKCSEAQRLKLKKNVTFSSANHPENRALGKNKFRRSITVRCGMTNVTPVIPNLISFLTRPIYGSKTFYP